MYTVRVEQHFSAAHYLSGYEGDCSRMHGHEWRVELLVSAPTLREFDGCMLLDFREAKQRLAWALEPLDHTTLNNQLITPTAERLAYYLYCQLAPSLGNYRITLRVWESHDTYVEYTEDR